MSYYPAASISCYHKLQTDGFARGGSLHVYKRQRRIVDLIADRRDVRVIQGPEEINAVLFDGLLSSD